MAASTLDRQSWAAAGLTATASRQAAFDMAAMALSDVERTRPRKGILWRSLKPPNLLGRRRFPLCGRLLVRARHVNDIEKVFPRAAVLATPRGDYLYRALVPRADVVAAIAAR